MSDKNENQEIIYATFGGRMLASVIDSVLSIIIVIPFFGLFYHYLGITKPQLAAQNDALSEEDLLLLINEAMPSFIMENTLLAILIIILWVYKSATPGKMLLKMKIVDAKTLGKPGTMQLIIRYLGYFISVIPLCLGFIWIHYDKRKQGFHDKLAGTVVIKY